MDAQKGDRITVESNKIGGVTRAGEVVEVLTGSGVAPHYRVRWDDGRETTFFPSSDAHLAPATTETDRRPRRGTRRTRSA